MLPGWPRRVVGPTGNGEAVDDFCVLCQIGHRKKLSTFLCKGKQTKQG